MAHSFVAYIDESGDEGFSFASVGKGGSSRWFVLSAVAFRQDTEPSDVKCMVQVRNKLGRTSGKALHFRNLDHESRVVCAQEISRARLRIISVLTYKPEVAERYKQKSWMYHWSTRLVLERLSWLCRDRYRDAANPVSGDGRVKIVFSHRRNTSYDDMREYLRLLKKQGDNSIDWNVVDPDLIQSAPHEQRLGLQIADVVASSFFYAAEQNRYGNTEEKYAELLMPRLYIAASGHPYGLKLYPSSSIQPFKQANHLFDLLK